MIRTRIPRRVSQRAKTRPVGPAPTIRTWISYTEGGRMMLAGVGREFIIRQTRALLDHRVHPLCGHRLPAGPLFGMPHGAAGEKAAMPSAGSLSRPTISV